MKRVPAEKVRLLFVGLGLILAVQLGSIAWVDYRRSRRRRA